MGPGGWRHVQADTDASAEHQGVRRVTGVVEHGAGNGGKADLVAVVGDARHHSVTHQTGMDHTGRELCVWQVGRSEAENVRGRNRVVSSAHHIADHTADAGVRTAERFDRRWMVVSLGLYRDRRARRERHDAGVADEGASHERGIDVVGRGAQLGQQRCPLRAVWQHHAGSKGLVRTVLAPGLGEGLELHIGGCTARRGEPVGDGAQLGRIECHASGSVDRGQCLVVQAAHFDVFERGRRRGVGEHRVDRPERHALDHRVRQQTCRKPLLLSSVETASTDGVYDVPATGGCFRNRETEGVRDLDDGGGNTVGHARQQRCLDHSA